MWVLFLLSLLPSLVFAQVVDVSTSKNAVTLKGLSPHVNFIDQDGNDYFITTNGNVIRIHSDASPLINIPTDGNLGIELAAVTGVTATAIAGGSLTADTTYYFVVTALDGFGETVASNEATCTTTVTNKTCQVSWTISPPPAESYRIYVGVATGAYTHYVGGIVSSPHNISSFPVLAGSPPEVTTAYRVRLSQAGVHYPDGTVQNTAGGFAAWSVNGFNIFSAQPDRIGIGDGTVFTLQSAKVNILCGNVGDGINNGHCLNLNNRGTIAAYLVNDVQMRSNINPSTGLLYDNTKSSWIFALGNNGDRTAFYRARPTTLPSDPPIYEEIFAIDGPPNTGSVKIPRYNRMYVGDSTSSGAGDYVFGGYSGNLFTIQTLTSTAPVTLRLLVPFTNLFSIEAANSPIETRMSYKNTLKFIDNTTAKTITMSGTTGNLNIDNGGIISLNDVRTFGHFVGAAMSKDCENASFLINSTSSPVDVVTVPNVTLSTHDVNPFISASLNGYIVSNNTSSRLFSAIIIRNIIPLEFSGDIYHMENSSGLAQTPVSVTLVTIDDSHPVGIVSYKLTLDVDTGDWNVNNRLQGNAILCVHELP